MCKICDESGYGNSECDVDGKSYKYCEICDSRVDDICKECGWKNIGDDSWIDSMKIVDLREWWSENKDEKLVCIRCGNKLGVDWFESGLCLVCDKDVVGMRKDEWEKL